MKKLNLNDFEHSFPLFGGCALAIDGDSTSFQPELILKLPHMYSIFLSGTHLLERKDFMEIFAYAHRKASHVILTADVEASEKILSLVSAYPSTGIRILLTGIDETGSTAYQKYQATMVLFDQLRNIGCRNIGVSMRINDANAQDAMRLYETCSCNGLRFEITGVSAGSVSKKSVNALHFITNRMCRNDGLNGLFEALFINELKQIIEGEESDYYCECGNNFFTVDQYGYIHSCLALDKDHAMGNLNDSTFENIWESKKAQIIRHHCEHCRQHCFMRNQLSVAVKRDPITTIPKILNFKNQANACKGMRAERKTTIHPHD